MQPGDVATLLADVYTHGKISKANDKGLYAKRGEKVKIISIHDNVAIVEGGQRFTVNVKLLSF